MGRTGAALETISGTIGEMHQLVSEIAASAREQSVALSEVNTAIKTACDYLNSDGVDPRNYVEQLAWMFFLKAFDAFFREKDAGTVLPIKIEGNRKKPTFGLDMF